MLRVSLRKKAKTRTECPLSPFGATKLTTQLLSRGAANANKGRLPGQLEREPQNTVYSLGAIITVFIS
jgi:hypothetical protein